ncbi:MAG TPA: permease [Actinomycetota bacterium]|nr:permease [Actinomycetota bacterium]
MELVPSVAAPTRSARNIALVALALGAGGLLARAAQGAGVAQVQTFVLIFSSLLIEALPFIVLGAVVSAAIEVFVPGAAFARLARLPRPLQMPVAGLGGFAFPVCECGSVPVARRLVAKGMAPAAAVTFMLAAPILNPVVLVSTAVAYRGREVMWAMVLGRAALGLLVALAVGWVVANRSKRELLRGGHEEGADHGHAAALPRGRRRWRGFFEHLAGDFVLLARYLVIGVAVAAALQTFVSQSVIGSVADTPVLGVASLMLLAGVLSLCSESDAFVAASFVQFGAGAQLAFLVFGPMVDAKLGFLYAGTFGKGFVRTVVVVVGAATLAATLWFEVLLG